MMKKTCLIICLLFLVGCQANEGTVQKKIADASLWLLKTTAVGYSNNHHQSYDSSSTIVVDNCSVLTPDGYGPGIHINRYGQPVELKPDFGAVPGEHLEIKTDACGPGIHCDQYGRAVREYPWP